jgi:integrase
MGEISFHLNKGKKITDLTKPQAIYLRFRQGRKVNFYGSLKKKVLAENWDSEKQVIANKKNIQNRTAINTLITNLRSHFETFDNDNTKGGITPNYEMVRAHFKAGFKIPETSTKAQSFFDFITEFIERSKTEINPKTKKNLSHGTVRTYTVTKNILETFAKKKYKIGFENLTLELYYDFIEYCESKNLSANYIGKHIKTLKIFLRAAINKGLTNNTALLGERAVVFKESSDNIYLNNEELLSIYNLDLTEADKKRHDIARDLFLIGAYTGLRVSDYNRLNPQNIKTEMGVQMLKVTTQKTGKVVAIPLHPIVSSILEKHNGNAPPKLPDQHINYLIKDVAEWAGIDSIEYITQTRGGKKITVKKFKFDLVKTHTARRSFCTNAYLMKMPVIDIMSLSGHTSEKSFLNYIKVTPEQRAIKISTHPFFSDFSMLKKVD